MWTFDEEADLAKFELYAPLTAKNQRGRQRPQLLYSAHVMEVATLG